MSDKFSIIKSIFTKKTVVITIVVLLTLSSTVTVLMFTVFNRYETSNFIEITSNDDVSKYNFPGDGSEQNPFLIEGLKFKSSEDFDIKIINTTYSYIIRNCYFTNKIFCLRIIDQQLGSLIVENNIFKLNKEEHKYVSAASIVDSNNIIVRGNEFQGYSSFFQFGLNIYNCSEVLIQDNSFQFQVVSVRLGSNITMNNDQLELSEKSLSAVYASSVTNITISNIQSFNSPVKFRIGDCKKVRLFNNTLQQGRIEIINLKTEEYFDHFVENNKIAGKPYGFFVNITDQVLTDQYSSLHLIQSRNISVSNQNQNDVFSDIKLEECNDCLIVNNSLADSLVYGIYVDDSNNTRISNNQIERTYSHSILISSSPNTTVDSNTVTDNFVNGYYESFQFYATRNIKILDSPNSTIVNNKAFSERCSLEIKNSPNTTISSNRFTSFDLVSLMYNAQFYSLYLTNNTAYEKELGIFVNQNSVNISNDYNQFIVINCTDISLDNSLIDITNSPAGFFYNSSDIKIRYSTFVSIDHSRSTVLYFEYCNNVQFQYVYIEKCYNGINLHNCSDVSFKYLSIRDAEAKGIKSDKGVNITIEFSKFRYCSDAIFLYSNQNVSISYIDCKSANLDIWNCDNITIQHSEFKDCDVCIVLDDCSRVNILNNSFEYEIFAISLYNYNTDTVYLNIINNILIGGITGIILDSITSPILIERNAIYGNIGEDFFGDVYGGIHAQHCEHITISNNYIGYNTRGIFLYSTSYCTIEYNIFEKNIDYAIRMSAFSHNNLVTQNNFLNNNKGDIQAFDDGGNNRWNSIGLVGNYWSNCIDQDNCKIDGEGLSHDYNPLDEPVDIPYNASYFNISASNSSYVSAFIISICSLLMVRVLRRKNLKR